MHSRLPTVPVVAFFSLTALAAPHGQNLMTRQGRPDNYTLNWERTNAVKAAFEFAWSGYKEYAFPHDELHPMSNSYSDSRYIRMKSEFWSLEF
jgi:mannosyl-oligosaccharide alpha-1,2-mannosidase